MKLVPSRPVRRLLAGLAPIVLVATALPLLAPTCGGFEPGVKTFAKGSIIIPMDVCYQCTGDADSNTDPPAPTTAPYNCNVSGTYSTPTGPGMLGGRVCRVNPAIGSVDQGDVAKAYGLVYTLIRNGISVYWVISPTKTHLDDYDLTVQYNGGPPVQLYNWTGGGTLATPLPTLDATINYMGGVFVVDGSDLAAASNVLQDATKVDKAIFSAVNLHVSNVAFQANVEKTMAGGWDAGLDLIPKLALLDVASNPGGSAKNSYVVIAGYLQRAGLTSNVNTPWPLGGTTAAGNHGQIYDRLTMEDFQPRDALGNIVATGSWTTSTFYKNSYWGRQEVDSTATDGYTAIWVPHWAGPESCSECVRNSTVVPCSQCSVISTSGGISNCTCTAHYGATEIANALAAMGSFQALGGDLFAECAGLGSFDGVPGNTNYTDPAISQANTHFQTDPTTPGFTITDQSVTPGAANFLPGNFTHPLMQIGDFEFVPRTGLITTFKPVNSATPRYRPSVVRLVTTGATDTGLDTFTLLPNVAGGTGSVVYMGGHSYSGTDGSYATAGTRLVLNTLFNLGAACIANGAACSTGLYGICATGTMACDATSHLAECVADHDPATVTETCNGLDDDCDGQVDEGLSRACYSGPTGTENVGLCHGGTQLCERLAAGTFGYGDCLGEQTPAANEICDGANNDCDKDALGNELIDEGLSRVCYTGPSSTIDPATGQPMGLCHTGNQLCASGAWGTCEGQQLPVVECAIEPKVADSFDNNCNGLVDEGCGCTTNATQACYTGPSTTYTLDASNNIITKGDCLPGTQTCVASEWGTCTGQVLPAATENCANPSGDADCDGVTAVNEPGCNTCSTQPCYEGAADTIDPVTTLPRPECRAGQRTVCTDGTTGVCELQILESPEVCDGKDNDCNGPVDDGAACGTGLSCVNGICVRTVCGGELRCPTGYDCNSTTWTCEPQLCPSAACPAGERCLSGVCDDPCDPNPCGPGTVCAGGVCTGGACYTTGCQAGQICTNGACMTNPCSAITCPNGTFCRELNGAGECVQSCAIVTCAEGQICGADGFCQADPCSGVTCNPGNICVDGTCRANDCATIDCGAGKVCDLGVCKDDPCAAVTCPSGLCLTRASIECTIPPCLRAQCFSTSNPTGEGTVGPEEPSKGGCGCGTGETSTAALLLTLGIALLPIARRRRAPGGGAPLLLVAAVVTGVLAGCPPAEEAELPDCGGGACNTDALVAPFITSITPTSGLKGSPKVVDVQISGARFQAGSSVRIFPTGGAAVVGTDVTDATHAVAHLSLVDAEFETYLLRVVGPDRVISNLATFTAVAKAPTVTSVTPTSVTAPTVAQLTVSGADFTSASECRVRVGGYAVALPSALLDPTKDDKLVCTLDTARVSAGATELWVVNEQDRRSTNELTVTVIGQLAVTALSPPSVLENTTAVVTVYGSGFSSDCVVTVDGVAVETSFVNAGRLTARIPTPAAPATLQVTVTKTGSTTPASLPLSVVSSSSTLLTVDSVTPQSASQGSANVTLTFTGTGDLAGSRVEFLPPGGSFTDAGPVVGTGGIVTAVMDFSSSTTWPAGEYQVRLRFPGTTATYSATFPFTLLSNVPTLWTFGSTPAGTPLQQGTTVSVSANGTNFYTGAQLLLVGSGAFSRAASNMAMPTANTLTGDLDLTLMDTGVYQLVAKNTTSANSNPLSFTVVPGLPSFATTTPISPTCAVQGPTPVIVTLRGNNFAKPDALGAGGSVVLIQNDGLDIPSADPAQWMQIPSDRVTVVSYSELRLTFDTTAAVASDTHPYAVKVANPGGSTLETATAVNFSVKLSACP